MSEKFCPKYYDCSAKRTFEIYLDNARMLASSKFERKNEFESMFCKGEYEKCPAYKK